jgi:hypothetical protein
VGLDCRKKMKIKKKKKLKNFICDYKVIFEVDPCGGSTGSNVTGSGPDRKS